MAQKKQYLTPDDFDDFLDDDDQYNGEKLDADGCFAMQIFSTGRKQGTLHVKPSTTVAELKRRIQEEVTDFPVDIAGMSSKFNNKTLKSMGYPKPYADANAVNLAFQAVGGAQAPARRRRKRTINFALCRGLKEAPSDAVDCMLQVRIPDEKYALMTCGCAISAESMHGWMKAIFSKSLAAFVIKCPHHKVEWDFDICAQVANMGEREYKHWSKMRDQRRLRDYRACPHCKNMCRKTEGVNIQRVRCRQCKGADWCWTCAQKWNHAGLLICGNKNCTLVQELTKELQECEDAMITYINAKAPSVRACPRCWTLMEHLDKCKHMKCHGCGKQFCFMCLGLQNADGSWNCKSHNDKCELAPRQNFMK